VASSEIAELAMGERELFQPEWFASKAVRIRMRIFFSDLELGPDPNPLRMLTALQEIFFSV
jgi:hypothetical protein